MNKSNMKMININMKKHLELRKKLLPLTWTGLLMTAMVLHLMDLPAILIPAMLHLILLELLMMAVVLLKRGQGMDLLSLRKLLPEMLTVIILRLLKTKNRVMLLMMAMEHQLELELKVTIQPQELLKKSMVLLVSMRGTRVAFPSLLWKENKDQEQLLMERMVV